MTLSQVIEFKIYKGAPSPYSLGASTAVGYDPVPSFIDLVSGSYQLYSVDGVDSYDYAIAGLKNGGIRAESAVADGNFLLANPMANVTETIRLVPSGSSTPLGQAAFLSALLLFARQAEEFQNESYQINPVYLKVQLIGDAAPRWALIVSMAFEIEALGSDTRVVSVTYEREPYWRAIPPGANPKIYAFDQRGLQPNTDYDSGDLTFIGIGGTASLQHFAEGTPFNTNTQTSVSVVYHNYLEVGNDSPGTAGYIPGDAPALVCFAISAESSYTTSGVLYVARSTKRAVAPTPIITGAATESMTYNGGDSTVATGGGVTSSYVVSATTGVRCDPPGASVENYYVAQFVYGAGAITGGVTIATWPDRSYPLNFGRYAVFIRGAVTSGLNTNIGFSLNLLIASGVVDTVSITPAALATPSLQYVGNFNLVDTMWDAPNLDGTGSSSSTVYALTLTTVARGAAVAATYQLTDIILVPYDECAVGSTNSLPSTSFYTMIDNTGYISNAKTPINAVNYSLSVLPQQTLATGQLPTAEPGIVNRFYFLHGSPTQSTVNYNSGNSDLRVVCDVVPRWRHLRDQV